LNKRLNAKRVHNAEKYLNVHNIGTLWEEFVAQWEHFELANGDKINFKVIQK
jgi:hypothetical protein